MLFFKNVLRSASRRKMAVGSCLTMALLLSGCSTLQEDEPITKEGVAAQEKDSASVKSAQPVQSAPAKKNQKGKAVQNSGQAAEIVKSVSSKKTGEKSAGDLVILAEKYYNGFNVKKDVKKGLKLFVEAADKGSGYACRRLGLEYSDFAFDDLTPRDDPKARAWFERGAKLGDAESMFYLSEFVFEGRGGPKDAKRGTELLVQAARAKSQAAAHRAIKLSRKGSVSLSNEDKRNFYALDKQLRDAVTMRGD